MSPDRIRQGGNGGERPRRELEEQARELNETLNDLIGHSYGVLLKWRDALTGEEVRREFELELDVASGQLMNTCEKAFRFLGAAEYDGSSEKYVHIENLVREAQEHISTLELEKAALDQFVLATGIMESTTPGKNAVRMLKETYKRLESERKVASPDAETTAATFSSAREAVFNQIAFIQDVFNFVKLRAQTQALKEQIQSIIDAFETMRASIEKIGEREH